MIIINFLILYKLYVCNQYHLIVIEIYICDFICYSIELQYYNILIDYKCNI